MKQEKQSIFLFTLHISKPTMVLKNIIISKVTDYKSVKNFYDDIFLKFPFLPTLQIGETFKHTIEEIEETFINSNKQEDVKLREELSKNLPIQQTNPIL